MSAKFHLSQVKKFFTDFGLNAWILIDNDDVRHTLEIRKNNELLASLYIGADHINKAEVEDAVRSIKAGIVYDWREKFPERLRLKGKERARV